MDINRLHYFCTIVRSGSLSQASELLGISQPALSKALKVLEAEVDMRLTLPSGRGIAITDAGQKLFREAEPIVASALSLKRKLKENPVDVKVARVGSFEVFTTYFLGQIVRGTLEDFDLEVSELVPGKLEQALLDRLIDIAITYLPIPNPELDLIKVGSIEMGVFKKRGVFEKTAFEDLPFVVPNIPVAGTPTKVKGLDGWPDDRYPRKIKHRVGMMEGALELCRQGLVAGYFPKFIVEAHNQQMRPTYQLEEIELPKKLKVNSNQAVYLAKRRTDLESSAFKKLAVELRKLS